MIKYICDVQTSKGMICANLIASNIQELKKRIKEIVGSDEFYIDSISEHLLEE